MKLSVNEGPIDRAIRISIGIAMVAAAAAATGQVVYAALGVGLIGLVTGITGFCPAYVVLGVDTRPADSSPGQEGRP